MDTDKRVDLTCICMYTNNASFFQLYKHQNYKENSKQILVNGVTKSPVCIFNERVTRVQ